MLLVLRRVRIVAVAVAIADRAVAAVNHDLDLFALRLFAGTFNGFLLGVRHAASADVQRYAQMVRADRELKLAGYEVFRFGAAELQESTAKADVKAFFEAVFKRYGVSTS